MYIVDPNRSFTFSFTLQLHIAVFLWTLCYAKHDPGAKPLFLAGPHFYIVGALLKKEQSEQ